MSKSNLLAYLMPPEEKIFYTYFEESADICRQTAELFNKIVTTSLTEEHIIEAKSLKHLSNNLLKKTLQKLNATFVTPIDREDIQYIAAKLNKITKRIVKACINLRVYRLAKFTENMVKQSETLMKATNELEYIVDKFKKNSSVPVITESNLRMKEIETHGDEILYMAMDRLFSGDYEALDVIKLRDIHKDLENALDSCFSISDQIVNIVLKQN